MSRQHLLSLIALILLGTLASVLLQNNRSLWRDSTGSAVADRIRQDKGSPEAIWGKGELTVVVFTDYQCPACRKAEPALQRAAVRDGNVKIVYKDWPIFGKRSERAAMVALAADEQHIYLPVHRKLMAYPTLNDRVFRDAVATSGGNWNQIEDALIQHRQAFAKQLAANRSDAFAIGLRGTPGYLIGPLIIEGALTEREFLRVFKKVRSLG